MNWLTLATITLRWPSAAPTWQPSTRNLGRYQEAALLLEQALDTNLAHLGDDHPTVAAGRANLAMAYRNLRPIQRCRPFYREQALVNELAHFGDDHPTVTISRSNLAMIYRDIGRHQDAALLFEQALASHRAQFEDDHPSVAVSRSNLGLVYQDLGRYEDAASCSSKPWTII